MMIPPFFTSCSSSGCTSTRSPRGFTLTVAISWCYHSFWFLVVPATPKIFGAVGKLFWLFLFVVVYDFELRVDNVAFGFARALFGTGMTARLRSSLWTGLWPSLR